MNKNITTKLDSLLSEAIADQELTKLTEDEETIEKGVEDREPKEETPEVESPIEEKEVETVKPVENTDAVETKEPEDKTYTTEEASVETIEKGVEDREPKEEAPEVESPIEEKEVETVKPVENTDAVEAKEPEDKEYTVEEAELDSIPVGTLERKPEEKELEVESPIEEKEVETVKPVENTDAVEVKEPEDEEHCEKCVKLAEGVLELTEEEDEACEIEKGVEDREPKEETPEVESPIEEKEAETVKPVENTDAVEVKEPEDKIYEALDKFNAFIDSLREEDESLTIEKGVEDREPKAETPEVESPIEEKEVETVKPVENTDAVETKEPEDKKCEACEKLTEEEACDCEIEKGVEDREPKEETPEVESPIEEKEAETVKPVENTDAVEVKEPEDKEYHSIKEAIALGSKAFDTEKDKKVLQEKLAIMLAHDNDDLLYEEYNRLLSEAEAIRANIVKKYSIISTNRTQDLVESMKVAEAKIESNKSAMFKKLNEQMEINAAKKTATRLTADETAFGK